MATALIVAAIASLAITSLIHSNTHATAQSAGVIQDALPMPTVPLDSGEAGSFAFGYVEFDQNPANVPGFSSWLPGSKQP
jgi:hypothetical protein